MAFIEYRDGKTGRSWFYAVYSIDPITGRRKELWKRGFKTKKAAQRAAREAEARIAQQNDGAQAKSNAHTVESFIREWFGNGRPEWRPETTARYWSIIREHILPAFGHLPLGDLQTEHIQHWADSMAHADGNGEATIGAGLSTLKRRLSVLSQVLRDAADDGLITVNPAANVHVPEVLDGEQV